MTSPGPSPNNSSPLVTCHHSSIQQPCCLGARARNSALAHHHLYVAGAWQLAWYRRRGGPLAVHPPRPCKAAAQARALPAPATGWRRAKGRRR
eukprot:5310807-Alexandrium_andersonii.AAC.1